MAVGVFLSKVGQEMCVVGSLWEIPTRQYQAAARKNPCKGNVLVGTQTIAFTALLRARRELIAQSSSNGPLHKQRQSMASVGFANSATTASAMRV